MADKRYRFSDLHAATEVVEVGIQHALSNMEPEDEPSDDVAHDIALTIVGKTGTPKHLATQELVTEGMRTGLAMLRATHKG